MKNRRSLLVNWTRPRTLRCSTITWCLRAAFSASSRLLGLKGEATRLKTKNISATIVADDKRFCHKIKRTTFSVRTGLVCHFLQRPGHLWDHREEQPLLLRASANSDQFLCRSRRNLLAAEPGTCVAR